MQFEMEELHRQTNTSQKYYEIPHYNRVSDTHRLHIILDFPEIDMTSILRSPPVCFLEEHRWGGKAQTVVHLPCRPAFRCHFQKL